MKALEPTKEYSVYGNKGNLWNNTAHIYKSGTGNLCGTPALAFNYCKELEPGCKECIAWYKEQQDEKES